MKSRLARRSVFDTAAIAATLVTLFAIAAVLDPDRPESFLAEVGAVLSVGLLLVTSSRCAITAGRISAIRDSGKLISRTSRAMLTALSGAGWTVVLSSPALLYAWSYGTRPGELGVIAEGAAAAIFVGVALGIGLGLTIRDGIVAAVSSGLLGAMLLWPGALGWWRELPGRFPGPDAGWIPVVTLSLVVLLVSLAVHRGTARQRRA